MARKIVMPDPVTECLVRRRLILRGEKQTLTFLILSRFPRRPLRCRILTARMPTQTPSFSALQSPTTRPSNHIVLPQSSLINIPGTTSTTYSQVPGKLASWLKWRFLQPKDERNRIYFR